MIHTSAVNTLSLDPRDLLLAMRCPASAHTPALLNTASTAIDRARALSTPRTLWRIFPLVRQNSSLAISGAALALPGHDIAEHLAGCDRCLLTATTLGIATERELLRLPPADALYFDTACSLLVEAAADDAEAAILATIDCAHTTFRFAPGYGDLPLDIQPQFLATLDAPRQLGLTLTASGLMLPRKSITGIVGIR